MKVQANTVRAGHVLEINSKLYVVAKMQLITPGKGGAFAQVEMKDIRTGVKTQERYRTQEMVERVRLDEHEMSFLFADGDFFTFMDQTSFEQVTMNREVIGDAAVFLTDGMICTVQIYEGTPLTVELPEKVTLKIVEADPVVKGQTATSSYKPAILENGVRVLVPPHIEAGTRVIVSTVDGSYVERAKD